jgi:hypothetical protein
VKFVSASFAGQIRQSVVGDVEDGVTDRTNINTLKMLVKKSLPKENGV